MNNPKFISKLWQIILIPVITVMSYVINDKPVSKEEIAFNKLSFRGRMKYYFKQIIDEEDNNGTF